jgi:hypothetical protein
VGKRFWNSFTARSLPAALSLSLSRRDTKSNGSNLTATCSNAKDGLLSLTLLSADVLPEDSVVIEVPLGLFSIFIKKAP